MFYTNDSGKLEIANNSSWDSKSLTFIKDDNARVIFEVELGRLAHLLR